MASRARLVRRPTSNGALPVIVAATVAVSFSAILIRIADSDPGTIVWLRMSFASVLLLPWAWSQLRGSAVPLSGRRGGAVVVSGLLLGGHFLLWTASLGLTSVASSVLLVSMHPAIVAPLGRRLGDALPGRAVIGIALALIGSGITAAGDMRLGTTALVGDLLALGGAACLAGYLLIGRGVRGAMGVAGYSAIAFAVVAATAVVATAAAGALHVPSARTTLVCLALAVVCTLGGHTAYNWALRHVPAVTVSVAFLGEPPLTALLAFLLLASVPSVTTLVGGGLILAGIAVTLNATPASPARSPVAALE